MNTQIVTLHKGIKFTFVIVSVNAEKF